MTRTIRIAMISGPRNISTTMMRAFENRADTIVHDEPFYACYLKQSGAAHPMRDETLAAQPTQWGDVARALTFQPEGGVAIFFEKHISFHFKDAPLDWVDGACVFHLIRDPRAMVASYAKKFTDVSPIVESYRVQRKIDERLQEPATVIDARDVLEQPEGMLRKLCDVLDIPFSNKMLNWPAGPRDSDGVWAPHWYDAVWNSTGFNPFEENKIKLSSALKRIADACDEDYQYFHSRRLRA